MNCFPRRNTDPPLQDEMMGQESTHWTDLAETGGVALWDVDVMLDRDASISSGGPLGGDRVGFVSGWSSLSRVVAALVGNATLLSWCDEACSSALKEGGTEGPLAFGSPVSAKPPLPTPVASSSAAGVSETDGCGGDYKTDRTMSLK